MRGKKLREGVGLTVLNLFFIALCFVTLIPILYALSVSFNGQNALLSSDFSFIPKDFTLDNYLRVFTTASASSSSTPAPWPSSASGT